MKDQALNEMERLVTRQPNILFFFTDQQRYDSLGCNGNAFARTPHIDALASSGARMENHIVANTICMPSRASLFTGRFPNAHHVWTNGLPLPGSEQTLPQMLQGMGYDTAAFGKLHLSPSRAYAGRDRVEAGPSWTAGLMDGWYGPYYGFDHVELTITHGENALLAGHYANDIRARFPGLAEDLARDRDAGRLPIGALYASKMPLEAHHSTWVADKAISYIQDSARDSRPFFLFCSFPDPHHPLTPPEPYASMFGGAQLPGPKRAANELATKPVHYSDSEFSLLSGGSAEDGGPAAMTEYDDELRTAIARTYGMVSLIDDSVGRVLKTLADLDLENDTIVVFTSDHGELLGDHWLVRKGPFPCRSLLRVSCIIRAPGLIPAQTVVSRPTSNTDLLPTLMSLVGGSTPDRVQGRSLVPALQGTGDGPTSAISMGWTKAPDRHHHQSLFTDNWRLSWFPQLDDGELYDLNEDPDELVNLYRDPRRRAIRDDLRLELHRQYTRSEEPAPAPVSPA